MDEKRGFTVTRDIIEAWYWRSGWHPINEAHEVVFKKFPQRFFVIGRSVTDAHGNWSVFEPVSGLVFACGDTQKDACRAALERIEYRSHAEIETSILAMVSSRSVTKSPNTPWLDEWEHWAKPGEKAVTKSRGESDAAFRSRLSEDALIYGECDREIDERRKRNRFIPGFQHVLPSQYEPLGLPPTRGAFDWLYTDHDGGQFINSATGFPFQESKPGRKFKRIRINEEDPLPNMKDNNDPPVPSTPLPPPVKATTFKKIPVTEPPAKKSGPDEDATISSLGDDFWKGL